MSELTTYRIYCFDASRKIVTSDWLKAASIEDAIAKAEARGYGSQCEIWDVTVLVAHLKAERREA